MALNLGGIIRLTYAVKNDVGALTNPTTVVLAITQPDGTIAAGTTVTNPPAVTGQLVYDFTATQAGLHSVHWATTGPSTAEDDMFVAERPASLLISIDEAVGHLRAAGVITSDPDREQLQWLCLVASSVVEDDLGRIIVRRTVTETYDGACFAIALRSTPVISIVSVVENGITLTSNDYTLNPTTGILRRGSTVTSLWFAWGWQNIVITSVAGYLNPPRSARAVGLALVQNLWQESQQSAHPALDESVAAEFLPGAVAGLPEPLRNAYNKLRAAGIA